MKLIIDIDDKLYKDIQTIGIPIGKIDYVLKAIKNSTPIPDNATNKDYQKADTIILDMNTGHDISGITN